MGLIHTRASKRRDRAAADLLREQARAARSANRAAQREAAEELPAWRQPTVGGVLRKLASRP